MVSGTALLKLKNVIRDARAGSKKKGSEGSADAHTDAAAQATKKARRLAASVRTLRVNSLSLCYFLNQFA